MPKTDHSKETGAVNTRESALRRELEIEWQLMRIFISQHLYVAASYIFAPIFVIAAFWLVDDHIPPGIWLWYGVCWMLMVARLFYHRLLVNTPPSIDVMRRRKRELTLYYALVLPFLWAYPIVFVTLDKLPLTLAIVCSSILMVMGLVSNTLTLPRLYISYTLVHISVMAAYLLYFDFPLFNYYVAMMLISVVSIFLMGLVNYRSILASILVQFNNTDLLAEVTQKNIQIENADRAKSRFLVAASHDLSQPLNALSLSVDLLDKQSDSADQNVIGHMRAAIEGLRKLFNDVLDVSRLDSDTVEAEIKPVNIQALVENLLMEFETLANNKNIDLRTYIYDQWILSDERQLERVVRNLLSNAIKYTDEGGRVLLGTRNHKESLRLEVWDNGQGIALDEQENIFEEFYQVGNVDRDRSKGIGLGLSLVRRICALLEHELIFKSTLGEGTMFAVVLPLASTEQQRQYLSRPSVIESGMEISRAPALNEDWNLNGYSVLFVDDEKMLCHLMETLLLSWGAQVSTASSLSEVDEYLKQQAPDILLTDYWLQNGETGKMVVERVTQKLSKNIPIIYMSGTTSEVISQSANSGGEQSNVAVMYKPVNADELQQQLIELM